MKIFFKALQIFFITLGVILLFAIIALTYFWIADPLDLRSYLPADTSPIDIIKTATGNNEIKIDNIDKNPLLTETQEAQLESLGIDPAALPTSITPAMEECFIQKLGAQRVQEIIQSGALTAGEILKTQSCL